MKFISPLRTIQIAIAEAISSTFEISLDPIKISLEISYPKHDAHYTSTIALALANRLNLGGFQVAEAIAQTCSQNLDISSQWQIQAIGKGWLNIFLSEKYIAGILLSLEKWQMEGITNCDGVWQKCDNSLSSMEYQPELTGQYAYARCCALIRLALRENLLPTEFQQSQIFLSSLESTEISLLMQNLAIAAYLESENIINSNINSNKSRAKLSRSLSAAFLQFYDHCRIFGVSREIVVRRLLLIRITQKLLIAIAPPEINYAMYL